MTLDSTSISQGFVPRGNFVAMPLDFPSVSTPILPDSSYVTAVTWCRVGGGCVFGGTSGREGHVFLAGVRPPHGYVVDLGVVPGARAVTGITITNIAEDNEVSLTVCANSKNHGLIADLKYDGHLADGIQEWSFQRPDIRTMMELPNELARKMFWVDKHLLCLTDKRLILISPGNKSIREFSGSTHVDIADLGITRQGDILALTTRKLLRVNVRKLSFTPCASLPPCISNPQGLVATPDNCLLGADNTGEIFKVSPSGTFRACGRTMLAPIQTMACLPDGRIYGMCGHGIGRFFYFNPEHGEVEDYGPVAAIFGAKRYAYGFCCSTLGPDNEIYFGEDDRGGHLWIYFPPALP